MINHYLSLNDVGLFGIGFRVAGMVGLVIVGFQGALTPLIYAHHRDPSTPAQLARIFRIFVAFALLMFLMVSVFAKDIMLVLTIPAYYDAANIVVFLIPAILLSNMYIFAPGTAIEKKTHIILLINVGGALLNVLLNAVLIPHFGIEGASVAKLISYGLVFGAYMWFSQQLYYVPHGWKSMMQATLFAGTLAYWISRIELSVAWVLPLKMMSIAAVILVILMTGLIRLSELQRLQEVVRQRFF
jgi:O-antigen/teichoic acid export membrane protein